jgi:hypothetical protein
LNLLLLKLTLAPLLVSIGTLAGRKWGPRVGGFVAGFPNTGGVIIFIIALEQGTDFGAHTAHATLLGLIALAAFNPAYVWTALRYPIWLSMVAGWAAFVAVMLLLKNWHPSLAVALGASLLALNAARYFLPKLAEPKSAPVASSWDLPLRMGASVAMVLGLTGVAKLLGPSWSGLLTPFPVTSTVLAVFAHQSQGPAGAERMLKGILLALNAVALYMGVLALTLPSLGLGLAFGLALGLGGFLQFLVFFSTRSAPALTVYDPAA